MSVYTPSSGNSIVSPSNSSGYSLGSSDITRTLPRQVSSGSLRGTQTVGYGDTKIDGSNNTITLGQGITLNGTNETIIVESVGTTVLTMGKNADNTFNFRVVDAHGIGLAQFGQFPDQSIALKVAQAGIEVSTAKPNQLVFSSSTSFTVLLQDHYTFPSFGSVAANTLNGGSYTTIPHNAGFPPNVSCFAPFAFPGVVYTTVPSGFPTSALSQIVTGSAITQVSNVSGNAFFNFFYSFDETNLYIGVTFENGTSAPVTTLPLTIYYTVYVLNASA